MKRLLLVLLMCGWTLYDAGAQRKSYFGLQGGFIAANLTNFYIVFDERNPSQAVSSKYKCSFYAGMFVEANISPLFSIQPEVFYAQQGTSAKTTMQGSVVRYQLQFHYLNIPVMCRYYVSPGKFSIDMGPQLGIVLSASNKAKASAGQFDGSLSATLDKGLYNRLTVSFPIGFSWHMTHTVLFSARANLGLSNVIKSSGKERVRDMSFQCGLGVRF